MPRIVPAVSRRAVLTGAAVLGAGVVGGVVGWEAAPTPGAATGARSTDRDDVLPAASEDPLVTGRRSSLRLASFDCATADPAELAALFDRWASAIGDPNSSVRLGFGASLFDARLGLAERKPPTLTTFSDVGLDAATSGGDLLLHISADTEDAASAMVDRMVALVQGVARPRWIRVGHLGPRDPDNQIRNPLGFVDGTGNPAVGSAEYRLGVVAGDGVPEWFRGGTHLCYRRIRIDLTRWSALTTADQQVVIGRRKDTGAPLSGGAPTDQIDLDAVDASGQLAIPEDSHVRLTAPAANGGAMMFRNSYDYDDGLTPLGSRDSGLLFMAYVADPSLQFLPVLRRMLASDRLNEFTAHTATGVWAFPADGTALGAGLV